MVCYINTSQKASLESFCADYADEPRLIAYVDADYAGDVWASKSASGGYMVLVGEHTFLPVAALCKKQSVVSHSSAESEIVSLEVNLRTEAIPILSFWDLVVEVMHPPQGKVPAGGDRPRSPDNWKQRGTN